MAPAGEGLLAQLARGEPVQVAALFAYVASEFGAQMTTGQWDSILRAAALLGMALTARKFTTPQANPAPAVKTVHLEQGDGTPIEQSVEAVKPVVTLKWGVVPVKHTEKRA